MPAKLSGHPAHCCAKRRAMRLAWPLKPVPLQGRSGSSQHCMTTTIPRASPCHVPRSFGRFERGTRVGWRYCRHISCPSSLARSMVRNSFSPSCGIYIARGGLEYPTASTPRKGGTGPRIATAAWVADPSWHGFAFLAIANSAANGALCVHA